MSVTLPGQRSHSPRRLVVGLLSMPGASHGPPIDTVPGSPAIRQWHRRPCVFLNAAIGAIWCRTGALTGAGARR
jgi:hypothetical protein